MLGWKLLAIFPLKLIILNKRIHKDLKKKKKAKWGKMNNFPVHFHSILEVAQKEFSPLAPSVIEQSPDVCYF